MPKRQRLRTRARLDRTTPGPVAEDRIPDASHPTNYQPCGSDAVLLVVIRRYWGVAVAVRHSLQRVASLARGTRNRRAPFAVSAIRARPERRGSLAKRVLYSQKQQAARRTHPAI